MLDRFLSCRKLSLGAVHATQQAYRGRIINEWGSPPGFAFEPQFCLKKTPKERLNIQPRESAIRSPTNSGW